MGLFTENTRVQVPAALHLCRLGYVYKTRSELVCDQKTNILVDEFMTAVARINPDKDKSEIKALLDNLISVSSNDDIGREFYEKIVATSGIRVIDFDHPGENSWICTTELPCEDLESHDEFRPDVTCFVNGLPLAFVIERDDGTKIQKLEKNVMRYQQLFATLAIRRTLDRGVNSGVIWHTQGSGKTALSFHNVKSLTDYYAAKETVAKFYFIVDRIDLLEQAVDEFAARGLVVRTAQSRDELMDEFKSTAPVENKAGKPEILVVNIQKFKDDKSKVVIPSPYNIRLQRVFFIDEAHRGYDPKGCFLSNLFDADRAAVKIAMTGTPLLKAEREPCTDTKSRILIFDERLIEDSLKDRNRWDQLPSRIQYVDIAAVSNGVVSSKTEYDREQAPGRARRIAKSGDTIWSSVRPNLRAYALVLKPQEGDVFSTGFTVLSPVEVPYGFLYLTVTTEAYVSYLVSRTGNSAYPAVLPSAFGEYEIAVPPRDLLDRFADQVERMFELRQNCFDEIQSQKSLREFLLPVLMNGQVKVG